MSNLSFFDFAVKYGRLMSEINPGSDEIAINIEDSLSALELIKNDKLIILGGDIITEDNNKLGYVIHAWGYEYCYLTWYCNEKDGESLESYALRSYDIAKVSINKAEQIAKKLNKKCFIVFVVIELEVNFSLEIDDVLRHGIDLRHIGFKNWGFNKHQSFEIIKSLKSKNIPILGINIFQLINDQIVYSNDKWVSYKLSNETESDFLYRTTSQAIDYISSYVKKMNDSPNYLFAIIPKII
jgi:hypothetical protein